MRPGRLIVVPLASPETAPWLGRLAGMLAQSDGGEVAAVSVVTPTTGPTRSRQAQEAVDHAAAAAREVGARATGQVVSGQQVTTAVLDVVDERDASLVLIGWQGHSTVSNVFGQLIDSIMGRSTVPLAVVRPTPEPPARVILPISDDHLLPGGERGMTLAAGIAGRLRDATTSGMVLLRAGGLTAALPASVAALGATSLELPGSVASAAAGVARAGDIIVTAVAPTAEGLRNATTHLAWATPASWQLVAIDVGPPAEVDVVSAVEGAGMVIEPVADPAEDVPHLVEVVVAVDGEDADPWKAVENAVRLVGAVVAHSRRREDGLLVNEGRVRILAPDPGTALSAIMLELDDARWGLGPAQISYRLVGPDDPAPL